jgi:hypothetical protein
LTRPGHIAAEIVPLVPRGESASNKKGALKTDIPVIPDAPIGDFRFNLFGGKKGYLINTRSLCKKPVVSMVEYFAQNGKRLTEKVKAKSRCGGGAKKRAKP